MLRMDSLALLKNFSDFIVNPAIFVIFAVGFFLFVWGLVQFILNLDNESGRTEGVKHMLWGIVGMFIMVSVYGIIMLLNSTFDLGVQQKADGSFDYTVDVGRLPNIEIKAFK